MPLPTIFTLFSYLRTKDDVEVDLIVERPGQSFLFIEIKSTSNISKDDISSFWHITKDFPNCEAICFSNDPFEKKWDHVRAIPWKEGLKRYFMPPKTFSFEGVGREAR